MPNAFGLLCATLLFNYCALLGCNCLFLYVALWGLQYEFGC